MTVELIDRDAAGAMLLRSLRLPRGVPHECICSELVRASLWAATRSKSTSHTKEVIALAAPSADVLGIESASLGACLGELAKIGDVAVFHGGYWTPGVLRYVAVPQSEEWLLLGSTPAAALDEDSEIRWHGNYRRVHRSMAERLTRNTSQELSSWMTAQAQDIGLWAVEILNCHLTEYSPSPNVPPFQIYAPHLSRRNARQSRRWFGTDALADGRHLARQESRFRRWTYSIVAIRGGRIVAAAPVPLPKSEVRRLLYGLDANAANPVRVSFRRSLNQFELWSELPVGERRLFEAFGALATIDDRPYPRFWTFGPEHHALVRESLERLQIQLAEIR